MVESTRVKARKFGRRVKILQMCAEELDFPDEMFDFVFGHSMLHHTDLELVRTQVYRVLKPGGKAVFLEPLGHNLAVNLFRKFTPGRRTSTEKPLMIDDIMYFAEPFSTLEHREFNFLTLIGFYHYLWEVANL